MLKTKIEELQNKMDLKKKYPGYFTNTTKWIINISFFFILLLVGINYYLDGNSFVSFSFSCNTNDNSSCLNPFYDCTKVNTNYSQAYLLTVGGKCNMAEMPSDIKAKICETGICDKEYVPNGFFVGRKDFFAKYSLHLGLLLLAFAFILNHIIFIRNMKKERVIKS